MNKNTKIKKIFGKKHITIEEVTQQLDDISLWDTLLNNVSMNTFSKDSIIPQVMMDELRKTMDLHRAEVADIISKMDAIQPRVEKKLKNIKRSGILSTSYDIFFQRDSNGNRTGLLVNRYTNEWYKQFEYYNQTVFLESKSYSSAIEKRDTWLKQNAINIDIRRIPEIQDAFKGTEYEQHFVKDDTYKEKLVKLLGISTYNEVVEQAIENIKEFSLWQEIEEQELKNNFGVEHISLISDKKVLNTYYTQRITSNPFLVSKAWNDNNGYIITDDGKKLYVNTGFSSFIPKKTINNVDSGFYDKNFDEISNDKDIYEYWKLLYKASNIISESFSDANTSLPFGSIPTMDKSFSEMLVNNDEKGGIFRRFKSFITYILDNLKKAFSVENIENRLAKDKSEINKNFYDKRQSEIKKVISKLVVQWNTISNMDIDNVVVSQLNNEEIRFISELLGVKPDKNILKQELKKYYISEHGNFNLRPLINSYARESVTAEYSQDLPKIFRTALIFAAEYNGRKQAEPIMSIFRQYYNSIERSENTSKKSPLGSFINRVTRKNEIENARENAIKRMDYFYNKAVKGNYDSKKYGIFKGFKGIEKKDRKIFGNFMEFLRTGKVYTGEEKEYKKQLEKSLNVISGKLLQDINSININNFKEPDKVIYEEIIETINNIE